MLGRAPVNRRGPYYLEWNHPDESTARRAAAAHFDLPVTVDPDALRALAEDFLAYHRIVQALLRSKGVWRAEIGEMAEQVTTRLRAISARQIRYADLIAIVQYATEHEKFVRGAAAPLHRQIPQAEELKAAENRWKNGFQEQVIQASPLFSRLHSWRVRVGSEQSVGDGKRELLIGLLTPWGQLLRAMGDAFPSVRWPTRNSWSRIRIFVRVCPRAGDF